MHWVIPLSPYVVVPSGHLSHAVQGQPPTAGGGLGGQVSHIPVAEKVPGAHSRVLWAWHQAPPAPTTTPTPTLKALRICAASSLATGGTTVCC